MTKDKNKKYTVVRKKPLMTQPVDVYYDGKKFEFKNENNFVDD